jgi:uncharacterized membrane protein YfcA
MGGDIAVIALGVAAGVLAGLFGVGGGILFVPALTIIVGLSQIHAEATSLLAIIPVALLGSWRQRTTVNWRDATIVGLVSGLTAVAGAIVADVTPGRVLRIAFAVLLVLTAAQLAWRARRPEPAQQRKG